MRLLRNLKTHHLLLATALLLFVSALLAKNATIDLHLADTYYIIHHQFLFSVLTVYFVVLGLIYLASQGLLYSPVLTRLHAFINIAGCVILLTLIFTAGTMPANAGLEHIRRFAEESERVFLLLALLVFSHIIYIVNFISGLLTRRS